MGQLSKEALLAASDLVTRTVDLPSIGGSVKVRSLPAAYSNQATSEALEVVQGPRGEQTARVNKSRLEILQVLHGLVDPKLDTFEEAERFAQQCGPAFMEIVRVLDEISGVNKEALEEAEVRFPAGGSDEAGEDVVDGAPNGSGGPDLHVRTGA